MKYYCPHCGERVGCYRYLQEFTAILQSIRARELAIHPEKDRGFMRRTYQVALRELMHTHPEEVYRIRKRKLSNLSGELTI